MIMKRSSVLAVKLSVVVALVLAVLIPSQASAQPFYATLKAGIYSPQTGHNDDFQTGPYGEVAVGWRFHRHFAAEMGLGGFYTEAKDRFSFPAGIIGEEKAEVSVTPITFTLKAILPYRKWEFFGLGGVGVYFVYADFRSRVQVSGPATLLLADLDDDDDDAVFGAHLGLGFHYNITPNVFVGAEGKYLWTGKANMDDASTGLSSLSEFKLNGILATAVLGFKF
jgi:opacity protein-like surface antigen